MSEVLLIILTVLSILQLAVIAMLWQRTRPTDLTQQLAPLSTHVDARLDAMEKQSSRAEDSLRAEINRAATDNANTAAAEATRLRTEVQNSLTALSTLLGGNVASLGQSQSTQLKQFDDRLAELTRQQTQAGTTLRTEVSTSVTDFRKAATTSSETLATSLKGQLELFQNQLTALIKSNAESAEALRTAVEARLTALQSENAAKLDQMRATVDEKLQGTLEKRLGDSFKLVSDRLEQVHRGLGEMQSLGVGVADLKRVMTNVKARGTWGEAALSNLLEQVLAPDQYEANFAAKERTTERVEFAIKLPGRSEDAGDFVWMPIDSKFPIEDYQRLSIAAESADSVAVDQAAKDLERSIRTFARAIRDKYINPPRTTDWAIMFLPTEGLYAEVLRRPGLVDSLQRDDRIMVAGPTTLAAFLNAIQMGFRTLAVQKKSAEVWKHLETVKKSFGQFGETLDAVQRKLEEASTKLDSATTKSKTISKQLDRFTASTPTAPISPSLLPDIPPDITEPAADNL